MRPPRFLKNFRFLPVLVLPVLALVLQRTPDPAGHYTPEKVNLALRRTADGLLRLSGDSTSRIPAVEQVTAGIWRLRLEKPFDYEKLPGLLQASFDQYGILSTYEVAIRRCTDGTIDLGYHQLDFLTNDFVPCGTRSMPEGCHYLELIFLENAGRGIFWTAMSSLLLLISGAWAGFALSRRMKNKVRENVVPGDTLEFGRSMLDVGAQILICNGIREKLTFRETKLLRLFAANLHRLLERDFILREVWADEGVLVGRSLDVFVSRLRKKLAPDPSLAIVAVHGVGYRLETGKS